MPEWANPAWLLCLMLVPPMYWLHRFRAQGRPLKVAALFLWRRSAASARGGPRAGPPDPAWKRRALFASLLALALAGPGWTIRSAPTVAVWLDEGSALFALEDTVTPRLRLAASALARALRQAGPRGVTLHALHRPGAALTLSAWDEQALLDALLAWLPGPGPDPPNRPTATTGEELWLVSTGADDRVTGVLHRVPFQRVIALGRATENLALIRLATRPSPVAPERSTGLVELINAGQELARRTLELHLDGQALTRWELALEPGERMSRGFVLPADRAGTLEAVLSPADALPLDDRMALNVPGTAGKMAIAQYGHCPPAVDALIRAHPGVRVAAGGEHGLRVWCGADIPADGSPTLWIPGGAGGNPPAEAPVWTAAAPDDMPRLLSRWVRPLAPPPTATGRALLVAGDRPLILEANEPARIALLFALDPLELARRPELAAMLALLLDRLAGRELALPVAAVARDPLAARIAPGELPAAHARDADGVRALELAPWLLAAAVCVVLYDLHRIRSRGAR